MKRRSVLLLLLAYVPWAGQNFLSSLAASQVTITSRLRTTTERDDARVVMAFEEAKQRQHLNVSLVTEPNPEQQTRDSILTITAPSTREATADLNALTAATQEAFTRQGPGQLFLIDSNPASHPVPNAQMALVRQICRWSTLGLVVLGLLLMLADYRQKTLPLDEVAQYVTPVAVLIFVGLAFRSSVFGPALLIGALPMAILALLTVVTVRVRKAAGWLEARAHITKSGVEVERHRFDGDTTKVKNLAAVTYGFRVGTRTIEGHRIGVGFAPADDVATTLKRYPVGANVAVFYNPANPEECLLEREPPASLGRIWTGAVALLLVYGAAVAAFWNRASLGGMSARALPHVHHPLVVIATGLAGLFCLASFMWNSAHPFQAFPWLRTTGRVTAGATESYRQADGGGSRTSRTYYKAVIEYSYRVDGQEYHNTIPNPGGKEAAADAEVAQHPVGMELEVFYDPKDPTRSALSVDTSMMVTGRSSLIVAIVLFAVATYAAFH